MGRHTAPEEKSKTVKVKKERPEKEIKEKKTKKGGKAALIVILVLLIVIASAVAAGAYLVSKSDKSFPNVFVGDTDVGKLTRDEVLTRLKSSGWETRTGTVLKVITIGGIEFEVDPVDSGVVLSLEKAADAACGYGRTGNAFENLLTYIKSFVSKTDANEIYSAVSDDYINTCISDAEAEINEYMGQELYTIDLENSKLDMVKGFGELKLDASGLKEEIISSLKDGKTELTYLKCENEFTCPDFDAIHSELEREPEDAYYTDDNKFDVVDEIVGCRFDADNAKSIWESAQPGEKIEIPIEVSWPEVTGEELRGRLYRDLLGAMTTEFPASAAERVSNVALCASKIDGIVLYPGDVFSYNDTVGPRTEEAGFKLAPVYVDGEVKTEPGGGACQVSSTIYAATLFAFLETVDRTCHQFPVSYMQLGTDATVAWPEDGNIVDFKFKNSKNYPIRIDVYVNQEEKYITVEIWGTLEDDDYMPVEFDNRYTWVNTYDRQIEPAYDDRPGYIIKLTHDLYTEEGYQMTQTHRRVIDSEGNEVLDEVTNTLLPNGNASMDTYYTHPE